MQCVLGRLAPQGRERCVIDSLPVPVVGFHHARGAHRWYGEASYGYVASKQQTIFGFKLHLLTTRSGLILDFALAPAHHADGALAEQLLLDKQWLIALGDKAYLNAALQGLLAWRNDLTPQRRNQREQLPEALTGAITHFRQIIETVNSPLAGQFQAERNHAKSITGLCARIQAKLAAHTVGLWLNCLLGRPLLARKELAVIEHNGLFLPHSSRHSVRGTHVPPSHDSRRATGEHNRRSRAREKADELGARTAPCW